MGQITVFSGPERRRRWSDEQRLQILTEAFAPGVCASERWRDLGLLTPEVRRRVDAARPDLASMWTGMTVTTERRASFVRGLRRHLDAILERQLAGEVAAAAASLAKLYPEPLDPRSVHVEIEGDGSPWSGEAVVLVADPAFERLAEELSRSPELDIEAYAKDYSSAFLERLRAHPGPAFAVVGRHGLRRLPDLVRDAPQPVVGIEVLVGSPGAISSPGGDMFGLLDGPVVTLPWSDGGRSRAADARRAGGVAHAVAAVGAAHRGDDAPMSSLARRVVFLRARGSGPQAAETGWGELYDRVWGMGVIPHGALCFSSGHGDGGDAPPGPDPRARAILFGTPKWSGQPRSIAASALRARRWP